MKEICSWKDGEWVPNSKVGTRLWDAHYFFGWAVFDAFRTYNQKFHLLSCHIDRLYRSARLSGIDIKYDKQRLIKIVNEVKEYNKGFFPDGEEYRFMIFASPGFFKIYDDMGTVGSSLTINVTTTSRYAKYIAPYLKNGVTSLISSQPQIPSRFLNPKIKSCSRLHYGLADYEATCYGKGVYPILLDEHGYVSESSGSNVGFIKDDTICLPRLYNKLGGCTERFLVSISDMDVVYDNWDVSDLVDSDGLFFTSTFSGFLPSWNLIYRNKRYRLNRTGKLTGLLSLFCKGVGVDVVKQWEDWYGD